MHRNGEPVSGMCPNSPAMLCAPVWESPASSRVPPMSKSMWKCIAVPVPRSTPRRASASPASRASLPTTVGGHASPRCSPRSTSSQPRCEMCSHRSSLIGPAIAIPTAASRSEACRATASSMSSNTAGVRSCSPLSSSVSSPPRAIRASVQESSRMSAANATGPSGWGRSSVVGRPRPVAAAGTSCSRRARSSSPTSAPAVLRPIASRRAAAARVRGSGASWTARSSRTWLWTLMSALVMVAMAGSMSHLSERMAPPSAAPLRAVRIHVMFLPRTKQPHH